MMNLLGRLAVAALVIAIIIVLYNTTGGFNDIVDSVVTGTDSGTTVGKTVLSNLTPIIVVGAIGVSALVLWIKSKFGGV